MDIIFFRFEDLPAELQFHIVGLLPDNPTLISFTLTSTRYRHLFWKFSNFNNWTFLDECATKGYQDLLRYAFRNGSLLDFHLLELAVKASEVETAEWLFSVLQRSLSRGQFSELAQLIALEGVIDPFIDYRSVIQDREKVVDNAAIGGHVELIERLKELYNDDDDLRIARCAAQKSQLDCIMEILCASDVDEIDEETWPEILQGAAEGGNEALIATALEHIALEDDFDYFSILSDAAANCTLESFLSLYQFFLPKLQEEEDEEEALKLAVDRASSDGNLRVLQWLLENHEIEFETEELEDLVHNLWSSGGNEELRIEAVKRVATLTSLVDIDVLSADLGIGCGPSLSWITVTDLKSLLHSGKLSFKPDPSDIDAMFNQNYIVDLELLDFAFDAMDESSRSSLLADTTLSAIFFCENNLEIFEYLERKLGPRVWTLFRKASLVEVFLVMSLLVEGKPEQIPESIIAPKRRLRYRNFFISVRYLVAKGFKLPPYQTMSKLEKARHGYTLKQIRSLSDNDRDQ